ncbi:MAG: hypothetical protein GVY09_04025 [Gammaproteobacteria bacterium]|jgi:hypothetical protein|nr:hypothetical protein [Gammaproteobacteria bacterium]
MEAVIIPLFRWSGLFIGFLVDGWLFDAGGIYLGWQDAAGRVWYHDGRYLGETVDEHYVLRRVALAEPVPQPRRVPPVTPELPLPPPNRVARPPRPGWTDALARFGLRPGPGDLVGVWRNAQDRMHFRADGRYVLHAGAQVPEQGEWALRGNLYLTPAAGADGSAAGAAGGPETDGDAHSQGGAVAGETAGAALRRSVFAVLGYDVETVTLRRMTQGRSLPFTMSRDGPPAQQ